MHINQFPGASVNKPKFLEIWVGWYHQLNIPVNPSERNDKTCKMASLREGFLCVGRFNQVRLPQNCFGFLVFVYMHRIFNLRSCCVFIVHKPIARSDGSKIVMIPFILWSYQFTRYYSPGICLRIMQRNIIVTRKDKRRNITTNRTEKRTSEECDEETTAVFWARHEETET